MTNECVSHGLIIKKEWLDRILDGSKSWEIRGRRTARRGPIALIESGSGHVKGTCTIIDVIGPIGLRRLRANAEKAGFVAEKTPYAKTYAWVLENPGRLPRPVPYRHPAGAVIWVELESDVVERVRAQSPV
jgi:hypothetical protein